MTKKILYYLKFPFLILFVITTVISCEKDFKNIGTDLVNNGVFSNNKYNASVKGHSVRIISNQTNSMTDYLLGYFSDAKFGSLTASFATQLTLPEKNPKWGENSLIDSVVITIPYYSKLKGKQDATGPNNTTIKVPNYELDSVFTSGTNPKFNLKIYELGTYLNDLDPTNPEVANEFFSDDVYLKIGNPLFSGLISPNRNDTMMLIKRKKYSSPTLTEIIKTNDTIKLDDAKPALRIPLDTEKIKQLFKDNDIANSTHFSSNTNFLHYFRGLYFEASNTGSENALAVLNMGSAYMTIYYTESKIEAEDAGEDLDGDQIYGELEVIVAHNKSFKYSFSGIKTNVYERNHQGLPIENYLTNPNLITGDDKLFVHGAAGSDAIIHLFGDDLDSDGISDELETLREQNWLITDAKLYLYVDAPDENGLYPESLYIYKIQNGVKCQISDIIKFGPSMVSGNLVYDSEGVPEYYLFHITNHISQLLNSSNPNVDFGIKSYDTYDEYNKNYPNDTIMKKYNNQFKGVILKGKNSVPTPKDLKFEIFYSKKNNG